MGRTIPESEQQARMNDIRAILALLTKKGPRNPSEICKHQSLTMREWGERLMRMRAAGLIEQESVTLQKFTGRYKVTSKGRSMANLDSKKLKTKLEEAKE